MLIVYLTLLALSAICLTLHGCILDSTIYVMGTWKRYWHFASGASGIRQGPGVLEGLRRLGPLMREGLLHDEVLETLERYGPVYYSHLFALHVSMHHAAHPLLALDILFEAARYDVCIQLSCRCVVR